MPKASADLPLPTSPPRTTRPPVRSPPPSILSTVGNPVGTVSPAGAPSARASIRRNSCERGEMSGGRLTPIDDGEPLKSDWGVPAASAGSASPYKPVPGPVDRVTFFTMQRRHRRASWRFSALAIVAVLLTGFPLSILITPLLYAIVLLVGEITQASWLAQIHELPLLFPHALAFL